MSELYEGLRRGFQAEDMLMAEKSHSMGAQKRLNMVEGG